MFGKIFESMFGGSLVGSGAVVFAVMSYVIAMQRPDQRHGSVVRIHPRLLATVLGEEESDVEAAIKFLCSPDDRSTSKEEGGRRLVQLEEFVYRVVNGAKYRAIRSEEERRAANREAQRKFREKNRAGGAGGNSGKPLPNEGVALSALERGDEDGYGKLASERAGGGGSEEVVVS